MSFNVHLAIDCGSPGVLRDGFLSGERFDYPNIIAFFCNDGFELIGKDTTRACQENGLWSGTMPLCQSKGSSSPDLIFLVMFKHLREECENGPLESDVLVFQKSHAAHLPSLVTAKLFSLIELRTRRFNTFAKTDINYMDPQYSSALPPIGNPLRRPANVSCPAMSLCVLRPV
jgi:hypothetical protein